MTPAVAVTAGDNELNPSLTSNVEVPVPTVAPVLSSLTFTVQVPPPL